MTKKAKPPSKHGFFCTCGCGRHTKYVKFALQSCKKAFYLAKYEAGEIKPDRVKSCVVCKNEFIEFDVISKKQKETCCKSCALIFANSIKFKVSGVDAPGSVRDSYCWRDVNRMKRQPCLKYKETCGEGCFRKDEDGTPCCYVEGFVDKSPGRQAVNPFKVYGW